jgi:hypothetical protein
MLVNNKTQKRRKEEEERGEGLAPLFRLAAKGGTPCKDEWGGSIPIAGGHVNHPAVVVWPPPSCESFLFFFLRREWFFVFFFFSKKKNILRAYVA